MTEPDSLPRTPDPHTLICTLVADCQPRSVLTLGHTAARYCAPYLAEHPDCRHTEIAIATGADDGALLARLDRERHADVAVIAGGLEHLDRATANAVIARLRDLHNARLLVLLPEKPGEHDISHWDLADLSGLGLRLEARTSNSDGETLLLYGFDIANYKRTPDWLNARHWANPEQWGKHRW